MHNYPIPHRTIPPPSPPKKAKKKKKKKKRKKKYSRNAQSFCQRISRIGRLFGIEELFQPFSSDCECLVRQRFTQFVFVDLEHRGSITQGCHTVQDNEKGDKRKVKAGEMERFGQETRDERCRMRKEGKRKKEERKGKEKNK